MLEARNVSVAFGSTTILHDVSMSVLPGEVVAILGPNGAGKSTLLAVLSGALKPKTGTALLDGDQLQDWAPRKLAQKRAFLPQHSELAFGFRVLEVVLLGRSPYAGKTSRAQDTAIAEAALEQTEVSHLSDRIYTTLSGGERQRVQMARILSQIEQTGSQKTMPERYLLLDEPTNSLDLAHQHAILAIGRKAATRNVGVVAILHDLNLAAMYADRILVLQSGRVVAKGLPKDVLTESMIHDAFGLSVNVTQHPSRECPHVIVA